MLRALVFTVGLASGLRRHSKSALGEQELANSSQSCDASQCSKLQSFLKEQINNDWECGGQEIIVGGPEGSCCRAREKQWPGVKRMYSTSKTFGGYTVLKLVDEGLLSLDTKVGDVLDWFNTNEKRKKVTVRHLLSMTSGIALKSGDDDPSDTPCRPEDDKDFVCAKMSASGIADAEPGIAFRYSQVDLGIVQEVAEQVTGLDFDQIFQKHISKPSGNSDPSKCEFKPLIGQRFLTVPGGLNCRIDEFGKIMQAISAKTLFRNKTLFDEAERPHTLGLRRLKPQDCTADGLRAGCKDDMMPQWVMGKRDSWKDGLYFHYGLTQWVECATPNCDGGVLRTSSPGFMGSYPWIDRGGLSGSQPHWGIIFRVSPKSALGTGGLCWPINLLEVPIASKIVK